MQHITLTVAIRLRSVLGTIRHIIKRRWLIPAKPIGVDILKHIVKSARCELINDSFNEKS